MYERYHRREIGEEIKKKWYNDVQQFKEQRKIYLLYEE